MSDKRIKIVISIPKDFKEKFSNMLHNVNLLNSTDKKELPIIVEEVVEDDDEFAAIPKKGK